MAAKQVRAKFTVMTKIAHDWGTDLVLQAVYSEDPKDENRTFWEATPAGNLTMTITNKPAAEFFEAGKTYYLDFMAAD